MEDLTKLSKKELIEKLESKSSFSGDGHRSEFDKIDQIAVDNNPHKIPFSVNNDHKNIFLYTAINKRIGPLHPDNAKKTMERWLKHGVRLFVNKRTDEQVAAFKETEEYKKYHKEHLDLRKRRHEQSKNKSVEKFTKEIAKMTASQLNNV